MTDEADKPTAVNYATNEGQLSDVELDRLQAFLDGAGSQAMANIETVDGFFAALICGPNLVMPHEYLPVVLGADHAFANEAEAAEMLGLLMSHWNVIANVLWQTLDVPDVYLPVLLEDSEGVARGNDWASGFMRGVGMRASDWRELMDSDDDGGALLPMMLLAHEHDPDALLRSPMSAAPEMRGELIQTMTAALTTIYRYFEPHRRGAAIGRSGAAIAQRRVGTKTGRNDRCPCGSGKKFKHCCAATATSLH